MGEHRRKRDRTARLLRLQVLLWQNPGGLKIEEIARKCSVSTRTAYRDLEALESELDVPIWEDGSKRGINEGYSLPPIPFTLAEAAIIFLAARLMQNNSGHYEPNIASTFMKLNSVVPPPLRKQIQNTINWTEKQPRNEKRTYIGQRLFEAWVSQRRVMIRYQDSAEPDLTERIIEPYFIEPAIPGHSSYVIAYCHLEKSIRIFQTNRIEDIHILADTYEIPPDFDAIDYLSSAWGIPVEREVEIIKLHFKPGLSRRIMEVIWHPSQIMEPQDDGSIIMTLRVSNNYDFRSWVLGWGDEVEVLEPETLRNQIIQINKSALDMYTGKKQ
jgi:predicted DNA-binding transcriptional regulator YafY